VNTSEADAVIRRALKARVVTLDGVEAPPNFSMRIEPEERGANRPRPLHQLFRSSNLIVRSRSPERVVRALMTRLAAFEADDTRLRAFSFVVVRDGEAIVLPSVVVNQIKVLQSRLNRAGYQVADGDHVTIDPGTAEVVIDEPSLPVDWAALDGLDEGVRPGSELPAAPVGRYRLRAWGFFRRPEQTTPTRADAVAGALTATNFVSYGAQRGMDEIAELLERVTWFPLWYERAEELPEILARLSP